MDALRQGYNAETWLCEHASRNFVPINGILELTPLCNMDCEMCFVRLSAKEQKEKGTLRTLEEWLILAKQMQKAGTLFVLLTGGEPLLYPEFRKLYRALLQMGMILTVNTNGTLIDEEWADFFAQYKPRRVNITIYGKDAETYDRLCHFAGGYEKAVRAVQLLRARGVDVKINGSVTPFNVADTEALVSLAKQLQVPWKLDTYMYPASRERNRCFVEEARLTPEEAARVRLWLMQQGQENFPEIAKRFLEKAENPEAQIEDSRAVSCRAGRSSFAVNWQGYLRPCIMVTKPQTDAFSQDFEIAWKEIVAETRQIELSMQCASCEKRQVCQVCAASALLETGSYQGTPAYMCQYTEQCIQQMKAYLEDVEKHGKTPETR